jgi:hypothetical protein
MTNIEKHSLQQVMSNLNKEIKKIEKRSLAGLIDGVIIIRRDMDKTSPKIPVDLGNLRSSWFVTASKGGVIEGNTPEFEGEGASGMSGEHIEVIASALADVQMNIDPLVICGFSANYALFVHENISATFQRPGAGAKFFSASILRNKKKVLEAIKNKAKIR